MHTALMTYRAAILAAESAPESIGLGAPSHVVIPTADRGTMRLVNTRARLAAFAEMVRKNWAAFGGGHKPADLKPARKPAAPWKAAAVQVWREQLELGQHADAARIGLEKLGARFFQHGGRAAFCIVAPLPVDGLPDCLASGRRDDGKWIVFDVVSGQGIETRGAGTRAAAELTARRMWAMRSEEQQQTALRIARRDNPADQAAALAAWCEARGVDLVDIPPALSDVEATDAPAAAAMVPGVAPAPDATPAATARADLSAGPIAAAPAAAIADPVRGKVRALLADALASASGGASASAPSAAGDIRAELDALAAAARERMRGGGAEIDAMTPDERARRHALVQRLPSYADERAAARARLAEMVARRCGTTADLAAPTEAQSHSERLPAPAGALQTASSEDLAIPCSDIGAATATADAGAHRPAAWRQQPARHGLQPTSAFQAAPGAHTPTRCSDIGASAQRPILPPAFGMTVVAAPKTWRAASAHGRPAGRQSARWRGPRFWPIRPRPWAPHVTTSAQRAPPALHILQRAFATSTASLTNPL